MRVALELGWPWCQWSPLDYRLPDTITASHDLPQRAPVVAMASRLKFQLFIARLYQGCQYHCGGFHVFARMLLVTLIAFAYSGITCAQTALPGNPFDYPSRYRVKPLAEQRALLLRYFPQLHDGGEAFSPMPNGAEGYFAIPRWEKIAPTYGEAVEKVFLAINNSRGVTLHNYRDKRLGPDYLREEKQSRIRWERLAGQQGTDIIVVPAQFGMYYRGLSVRRVREKFTENEFGLGAYHVAIMLLTHPERLATGNELWVYAPGDEYSYRADGRFELAPIFYFRSGEIGFDVIWFDGAYDFYGSASGFISR